METYANEEERLEALQRWWKENRQSVVWGVALGIAVLVGWNMWRENRQATAEQASVLYQQLLKATETGQSESAVKLGERIVNQYASTAYAEFSRLFLARLRAESGDLQGAKKILEDFLSSSRDDSLKTLATLRLARVMLAAGEIDPALKLLAPYTDRQLGKFAGLYEELRGDLYAAGKRPEEARRAYEKARALGESSPFLEFKLNDLPAAPAAAS